MKIALTAGHDRYKKQGAVAYGITENTFWNDFLEETIHLLPEKHSYRLFHRPNQSVLGYRGAVRELHSNIDHWGADVDIEFHFNAANGKVTGHEVLCYKYSANGKRLAKHFNKEFSILGNHDRGVKTVKRNDRGGYQLYVGKSTSILVEPFFGVPEIKKYLPDTEGRAKLQRALINFIESL